MYTSHILYIHHTYYIYITHIIYTSHMLYIHHTNYIYSGKEYEEYLIDELNRRQLCFETEEDLRKKGIIIFIISDV